MPTTFQIPARRERHCAPCEHHKSTMSCRGGPGNVWDNWVCMHPEAFNDKPLSDNPETAAKQKEIRARIAEHGRTIGKTDLQPSWCPLLKLKKDGQEKEI